MLFDLCENVTVTLGFLFGFAGIRVEWCSMGLPE
jgi:hypothetical protein